MLSWHEPMFDIAAGSVKQMEVPQTEQIFCFYCGSGYRYTAAIVLNFTAIV